METRDLPITQKLDKIAIEKRGPPLGQKELNNLIPIKQLIKNQMNADFVLELLSAEQNVQMMRDAVTQILGRTPGNRNHTAVKVAQHLYLQQSNFVWTDAMKDRDFGIFRFGIGISTYSSLSINPTKETLMSFLHVRGTDRVHVTVTAETSQGGTMLLITSCGLINSMNTTKLYFIQNGCLDNKTVENVTSKDNKLVLTLRLSGISHVPGSSMVIISCDVKLCLNSNQSHSYGLDCSTSSFSKQSIGNQLETGIYHLTAKPIYVIQEKSKASTNHAALVIGMVLGGTVVAVVVLLVRKSFSGVQQRSLLVDL
ncbi:uncharacterized protein PAF06_014974 [Gastrophryne carolinensis]